MNRVAWVLALWITRSTGIRRIDDTSTEGAGTDAGKFAYGLRAGCRNTNNTECGCRDKWFSDYRGTINETAYKTPCQDWAAQTPHSHSDYVPGTPEMAKEGLESNYCRNPEQGASGAWCYTTDPNVRWDYCEVPACGETTTTPVPTCASKAPDCGCHDVAERDYRGDVSETVLGDKCLYWSDTDSHYHSNYLPSDPRYAHEGLEADNCRNPDSDMLAPWCYTMNAERSNWDYCSVKICPSSTSSTTSTNADCGTWDHYMADYRGTISVTENGDTCQNWADQKPHFHRTFIDGIMIYENAGLDKNYCRNPLEGSKRAWCYTTNPDVEWDYCAVDECTTTTSTTTKATTTKATTTKATTTKATTTTTTKATTTTTTTTTTMSGDKCIPELVLNTLEKTNGFKVKTDSSMKDGVVMGRRENGKWTVAKKGDDYWDYIDGEEYKIGEAQTYEITVGDGDNNPLCGIKQVYVVRNDPKCIGVKITKLVTDDGDVDGFETSASKADVVMEVDGELPDGHVLEASIDGVNWTTVEQVDGDYKYTLTNKNDKGTKFEFVARIRNSDEMCPFTEQDVILDPYKPEFDIQAVEVATGEVSIVDIDTSRGDEGINYEIVSVISECGEFWSKKGVWYGWDTYIMRNIYGYMYVSIDNPEDVPYAQKEFSGFSGLDRIEFDADVQGSAYNNDVNVAGVWGMLDLYFDGVKYVTWENFKDVVPIAAHVYEGATISPTEMPVTVKSDPFETFRISIPWDGKEKGTLRFEFRGGEDDWWLQVIRPVGDTALGTCDESEGAKSLFEIDPKTGELKFTSPPDSEVYYRVNVKATTEVGLEGDVTIKVGVH